MQLKNTRISDNQGDLGNYWDWEKQDAYLFAGAITSDITDMLTYAQLQLNKIEDFKQCHESLKEITASSESFLTTGIQLDKIGMSWIIDEKNHFIWHNGGTGNYNSYIGFCSNSNTAVVVLSNLPPIHKIPAAVLGIKLLQSLQ